MSSNSFGNTIAVGNITDLASILANLTPEQLQNIQLDPTLYDALAKSIEPTTVVPPTFQPQLINSPFLTTQAGSNVIINQPVTTELPLASLDPTNISVIDPNINNVGIVVSDANGQILSSCTTTLISSQKNEYGVAPSNMVIQQSVPGTTSFLATYNTNGGYTFVTTPQITSQQQTMVMQNMNGQPNMTNFIPPGEASSLILTPTVMSQVQPSATVQTINISNPVTANLTPMESVFISPTMQNADALQTFNICNQEQLNQPAKLTFQVPITSSSLLPSTITIDPTLLKNQNISLGSSSMLGQNIQLQPTVTAGSTNQCVLVDGNLINTSNLNTQNLSMKSSQLLSQNIQFQPTVTTVSSNQCVLVDGNLINTNNLVGLTSGSLSVQQVLVSDMVANQSVVINNLPQTFNQAPVQSSILQQIRPQRTAVTPKKQQITASSTTTKKSKSIQTASKFSPYSPMFNLPKSLKSSTAASVSSNTPGRNIIVTKKTINVIKKSEGQVIPMKPTSVEQVQPGVFKFQLKKVDSSEAAALMAVKGDGSIQKHPTKVSVQGLSSLLNSNGQRSITNLQKIGRTAMQMSSANVTTATSRSTATTKNNNLKSLAAAAAMSSGKASPSSGKPVLSSISSVSGITIKTSTLPKEVLSRLKGLSKYGTVKVTTSSLLVNKPISLPSTGGRLNSDKKAYTTSATSYTTPTTKFSSVPKTISTKAPMPIIKIVNGKANMKTSTSTTTAMNPSPKTSPLQTKEVLIETPSRSSPEPIFIAAPHNTSAKKFSATPHSTPTSTINSQVCSTTTIATITTTKTTTNVSKARVTLSSNNTNQMTTAVRLAKSATATKTIEKSDAKEIAKQTLEDDLECKEQGFVFPADCLYSATAKSQVNNSDTTKEKGKKPVYVLEKAKAMLQKAKADSSKVSTSPSTPSRSLSSKEMSEMESIREAIESTSRVGQQEVNMRELAKQEIEKQLKRFGTSGKKTVETPPKEKAIPAAKKITDKKEVSNKRQQLLNQKLATLEPPPQPTKHVELKRKNQSEGTTKSKSQSEGATKENTEGKSTTTEKHSKSDNKKHSKLRKKQLKAVVIDENRKRERPKKFDDFILAPEPKKDKKPKKFFFPKEAEEAQNLDERDTEPTEEQADIIDLKSVGASNLSGGDSTALKNSDSNNASSKGEKTTPKISKQTKKVTDDPKVSKPSLSKAKLSKKSDAKSKAKTKKKSKKRKPIAFEAEVLPGHLKTKSKARAEDPVIDVSKVKLKSSFTETSFVLDDTVKMKTYKLLNRKSWACTLCGRPGNLGNLDVLFGPYKIDVNSGESKKETPSSPSTLLQMSVWLHRDCAIWTSNICLSNQTLCGLGESLDGAAATKCCLCSQVGATLQCGFKQCRDGYHFVCAKQRGCSFQMENFTITCPKHR